MASFVTPESQCDKWKFMMLHNDLEISSSTSLTCKKTGMRCTVYQYVKSSLHFFRTNETNKDWYITPLKSILEKK